MTRRRTSGVGQTGQSGHEEQAKQLPRKFLFTLVEAAELLSISRATLYREMSKGELESIYVGGRRLVPHAVLAAYVRRLMHEQGVTQYLDEAV